jgi:hypothetical protein
VKDRGTQELLLIAAGVYILSKLGSFLTDGMRSVERSLQEGGAKLYERVHPDQKEHRDHLPGRQLTRAQLRSLMVRAGFSDPDVAVAIALAESGGVPGALGDGGISIGLFQINTRAHPRFAIEALKDPVKNVAAAFEISRGGANWKPWSTWWANANRREGPGMGRFRRYLPIGHPGRIEK